MGSIVNFASVLLPSPPSPCMMIRNCFIIFLCVNFSLGENYDTIPYEEEARLAYYTTTGDGSTFMTFNGTSMQNLVVLGVLVVVLASLLLPYLGLSNGIFGLFSDESNNTNRNDFPELSSLGPWEGLDANQIFKRRSGDIVEPVIKALTKGHTNYGN